jgi:LPXTG-motif cell wall-anchored protein
MRTRSSIRLMLVAAGVVALVLAIAPVSFAGEDPGPTQVGEVQAAPVQSPAASQGPATATQGTLGVSKTLTHTSTKDTVHAVGGVQTGLGGMAAVTGSSPTIALTLAGGGVLLLLAAGGLTPLRRRQDG